MKPGKRSPANILFIISLLPYLAPFAIGIYEAAAKSGAGNRTPLIMFLYGFLAGSFVLTFMIPVFMVCFSYQVFYIVRLTYRHSKKVPPKQYWTVCGIVCGVFAALCAVGCFINWK